MADPNILKNDGLDIGWGDTEILNTADHLNANDPDGSNPAIKFVLNSVPSNGVLLLNGVALGAGDSFTKGDLTGGLVSYEQSGNPQSGSDSFDFFLEDENGETSGVDTFAITFEQDPFGITEVGTNGFDNLIGTAFNDILIGKDGGDNIVGLGATDVLIGGPGDDQIFGDGDGSTGNDFIYAGSGNDLVNGNAGDDTIYGEHGDDQLHGSEGHDFIDGGFGEDFITGGPGDDTIYGGQQDDRLFGEAGDDTIYGGNGDDFITGGDGNDVIDGSSGNDTIYGEAGDDVIEGNRGHDLLNGGAGADTFVFGVAHSRDVIEDFQSGVDTIEIRGIPGTDDFGDLVIFTNGEGGSFIKIGGGRIELIGIGTSDVDSGDFVFS